MTLLDNVKEYRSKNKNQYNIIDILDILDKEYNLGPKTNCSFYMSRQVYEEWCRWCKVFPSLSTADLTDKALIYAMLSVPNKNALVQVEIPEKSILENSLGDELQEMIIRDELETLLGKLRVIGKQSSMHITKKKQFLSVIRQYQKLNNPSEEIQGLMYEAKGYFE